MSEFRSRSPQRTPPLHSIGINSGRFDVSRSSDDKIKNETNQAKLAAELKVKLSPERQMVKEANAGDSAVIDIAGSVKNLSLKEGSPKTKSYFSRKENSLRSILVPRDSSVDGYDISEKLKDNGASDEVDEREKEEAGESGDETEENENIHDEEEDTVIEEETEENEESDEAEDAQVPVRGTKCKSKTPVKKPKFNFGGGPECWVCNKPVYFNEEKRAINKVFHKTCFRCSICHKTLDSMNCTEHDSNLFCKVCHAKSFGPKGYGICHGAGVLASDRGEMIPLPVKKIDPAARKAYKPCILRGPHINKKDPDCCPRCGRRVYFAEQVLTLGRKWHKLCFRCANCGKTVDSTNATDHKGDLYCRSCYIKYFGTTGYGRGTTNIRTIDSGVGCNEDDDEDGETEKEEEVDSSPDS